jgi:hypothetical protein
MVEQITARYRDRLSGILSCYDRIVITGTIPGACYAAGMTTFLHMHQIRIFDYTRFAEPLRERIRSKAQLLAVESGVTIEHVSKSHIRKEDLVAAVLKERGDHPGLVHIISAMEACDSYEPWHNKTNHKTYLKSKPGKCLHYYFYFQDEELGLIYLRVPTWCPFRLQFYCNGHNWLARMLTSHGIGYKMADNAFIDIDDWNRAQELADSFSPDHLHRILDRYAAMCCPVLDVFDVSYHWSIMQIEYSTDLVFRSKQIMQPLYEELSRQAILSVKAEQVATFLGKKITPQLAQEIGSRFATRIEGTCIKHRLGKASVKMYDKFGRVLRLETTTNDVTFFKHHRKVEHRDGTSERCFATIKKSIYSIIDLREVLLGCNKRYLEYLSSLDDFSAGHRNLDKLIGPQDVDGQKLKGLNFFDKTEQALMRSLQRPEFNLKGMRRADLKPYLSNLSAAGLSRQLWRFRKLGIIKKIAGTYRYYLTRLGRSVIAACCRITELTIVPTLAS